MGWLKRWRERYTVRWRSGEIDDATYLHLQKRAVWNAFVPVFGVLIVVCVIGLASEGKPLTELLAIAGFLALIGVTFAWRLSGLAAFAVRNEMLQRYRERVEADPAAPLVEPAARPQVPGRFYGVHRRSNRYTHGLMVRTAFLGAIVFGLWRWSGVTPALVVFAGLWVYLALWCIFLRLDRRPFLELSAEGIWCRAWGTKRLSFADFKAVYPRQNRWDQGLSLVPRDREQLRVKLSWLGRLHLRSGAGGGVAAHVGTLTLWANRVDLPQAELLRAIQGEIVARRSAAR